VNLSPATLPFCPYKYISFGSSASSLFFKHTGLDTRFRFGCRTTSFPGDFPFLLLAPCLVRFPQTLFFCLGPEAALPPLGPSRLTFLLIPLRACLHCLFQVEPFTRKGPCCGAFSFSSQERIFFWFQSPTFSSKLFPLSCTSQLVAPRCHLAYLAKLPFLARHNCSLISMLVYTFPSLNVCYWRIFVFLPSERQVYPF